MEAAPERLALHFDRPVDESEVRVRVLGAEGDAVTTGPVESSTDPGDSGGTVSVSLPDLDDGGYLVAWNAAGASGGHYFWIDSSGQGAVEIRAGVEPEAETTALRWVRGVARSAGWLSIVVLVGSVAAAAIASPPTAGRRSFRRVVWAAWAVATASALAGFLAEGMRDTSLGLGAAFEPERWRDTLDTTVGLAWAARLLLLGVAMPLVAWLSSSGERAIRSTAFRVSGALIGVGLLVSVAAAGDGIGGLLPDPGLALGLVHLAALTVLVGALIVDLLLPVPESDQERRPTRAVRALATTSALTVLVTAAIAAREPEPPPASPEQLETTLDTPLGEGELDLTVSPARIGLNDMHLYLFDASGGPADTESADLTVSLPSEEIGPITVPLIRIVPSHYSAYSVPFPLPGYWETRVTTAGGDDGGKEATASLEIP